MHALFATYRHEFYDRDTGKRIRRSLRNRFVNGGALRTFPYGYHKRAGAKLDSEVTILREARPIYQEWFQKLDDGVTYSEVAAWLIERKVPVSPGSRNDTWDSKMVRRITRNPILKGLRQRNSKVCRRVNSTGRHKSINAPPEELLVRECPQLVIKTVVCCGLVRLSRSLHEGLTLLSDWGIRVVATAD